MDTRTAEEVTTRGLSRQEKHCGYLATSYRHSPALKTEHNEVFYDHLREALAIGDHRSPGMLMRDHATNAIVKSSGTKSN